MSGRLQGSQVGALDPASRLQASLLGIPVNWRSILGGRRMEGRPANRIVVVALKENGGGSWGALR
jgi:hypothetical protein